MTGKSYAVTDYLCKRKKKRKDKCKNYWMRIADTSTKALLANKADKLVDPDLKRKYNLDLTTKGMEVYDHGEQFMTVVPLASFAKLKGVGFFDKDYDGEYNIVLDEFQLEQGEKRTSFDILYNFIGMLENIARTTKDRIKVFLLANTLEEAGSISKAFNFQPIEAGRYYLRKKRCVMDIIPVTEEYKKDRDGSLASLLGGDDMSNFTNEIKKNVRLITKKRTIRPTMIIHFKKPESDWFVVYDGQVIKRYKHEQLKHEQHIGMRPYLGYLYGDELKTQILDMYDAGYFLYDSLITLTYFTEALSLIRKT